jgi:hypothetical protein
MHATKNCVDVMHGVIAQYSGLLGMRAALKMLEPVASEKGKDGTFSTRETWRIGRRSALWGGENCCAGAKEWGKGCGEKLHVDAW